MHSEADVYLSDNFAEFSGKVTALHERKKEMFAEFKKLWDEHKAATKAIDDEALDLKNKFEEWKTNQMKPPSKPPQGRLDGHNV